MPATFPASAIAALQFAPALGDFAANSHTILAAREKAPEAALLVTPALALAGGPLAGGALGSLAGSAAFGAQAEAALRALAMATAGGGAALLVGTVVQVDGAWREALVLLDGGGVAGVARRDGPLRPLLWRGTRVGVLSGVPGLEQARQLREEGADLLLVAAAAPFRLASRHAFEEAACAAARAAGLPLLAVSRVGGQDGLVFAGGSVAVAADGDLRGRLPFWEEACQTFSFDVQGFRQEDVAEGEEKEEALYHALLTGLRSYVGANGFPGVVLGLSGGIDSAFVAALAVDALGADKVWGVLLPGRYTSEESLALGALSAERLHIRHDTVPIEPAVEAFAGMLAPLYAGHPAGLAEENTQARTRMVALMGLSNKFGHMLLATGNKSELSVGYSTIYGDLAGGYAPIKDLYKTEVFALSRWRNTHRPRLALGPAGEVVPARVIARPPSAELHAGQRDDDSLPPYETLDAILKGFVEEEAGGGTLVERGFPLETVARVEKLLLQSEYKRQQAPPGTSVGAHTFDASRAYPITSRFRTT